MNLELLAKVLQDAGIGAISTDIFVHAMPAETKQGVMLRNPLAGTKVDIGLPGYYRSTLQAIVRDIGHADGDLKAKAVIAALTMFNRAFRDDLGNLLMKVNHIYPEQLPIVYPHTPSNAIEWSLNFVTSYVQP